MTTSSKQAYANNAKLRRKHRELVHSVCFLSRTNREIATATGLKYNQVQKRSSELHESGELKIIGLKIEGGYANSIYIQSKLSDKPDKKPTLKSWLKLNHPDIYFEYMALVHHEI